MEREEGSYYGEEPALLSMGTKRKGETIGVSCVPQESLYSVCGKGVRRVISLFKGGGNSY